MMLLTKQPEPAAFNDAVRVKGLAHLKKKGFALDQPLPAKADIDPYWRDCFTDLHHAYKGICAYLCVHIERVTGGGSVDHFIPKSARPGLAYEWGNYRLACSIMNSRKNKYDDVIDPFSDFLIWELFRLDLISGTIYPSPGFPNIGLNPFAMEPVKKTIERLGLDDSICRATRVDWFNEYVTRKITSDFLKRKSPFVWFEANRQGLL